MIDEVLHLQLCILLFAHCQMASLSMHRRASTYGIYRNLYQCISYYAPVIRIVHSAGLPTAQRASLNTTMSVPQVSIRT